MDPNKAVEEVEFAAGVGSRAPVSTSDLIGFLSEAGVLPDLILYMRRQGAVLIGLENNTYTESTCSHYSMLFRSH